MSAQWESQSEREVVPPAGAGWLVSLAAAISLPIDALLRGMIAAGQGLQVILDYLGLSPAALEAHIVRLGLPMPHDLSRRRAGGRNPWTDEDVRRLIAWRLAGIHPESIGLRLGRSAGSVRAKSRRIGVPTPDRRQLRKAEPERLAEPTPECWSGEWAPLAPPPTPQDRCGMAAGTPSVAGAANAGPPEPVEAAVANVAAVRAVVATAAVQPSLDLRGAEAPASLEQKATKRARGKRGGAGARAQRELRLLQVLDGSRAEALAAPPVPVTLWDVDLEGDLTWMSRVAYPQKSEVFVWTMGVLFLSGLHWRDIAARTGCRPRAVSTMRTRFAIPIVRHRREITRVYDSLCGKMSCVVSKFILKFCDDCQGYFWCHRDDHGIRNAPMVRRRKGLRDARIEGRSQTFRLVTRAEIDRLPRHLVEPFANNERLVGIA